MHAWHSLRETRTTPCPPLPLPLPPVLPPQIDPLWDPPIPPFSHSGNAAHHVIGPNETPHPKHAAAPIAPTHGPICPRLRGPNHSCAWGLHPSLSRLHSWLVALGHGRHKTCRMHVGASDSASDIASGQVRTLRCGLDWIGSTLLEVRARNALRLNFALGRCMRSYQEATADTDESR